MRTPQRHRPLRLRPLVVVATSLLVLSACGSGGDSDDAAGDDEPLVVYVGRDEELVKPLIEQFTVLPLNSEVARLAGSWMAHFDNAGLGWMDAFIAASAKLTDMPLLTRDNRLASLLEKELTFVVYD